jgi:hypothetical protein
MCQGQLCLTGMMPVCVQGSPFNVCKEGGACAPTEAPVVATDAAPTSPRSTFAPTAATEARICASHEWVCRNKQCIRDTLRCDGHLDCDDGSDELCSEEEPVAPEASVEDDNSKASSEKSALAVVGTLVVLLVIGIVGFIAYRQVKFGEGPMTRTVNLARTTSGVELKTMRPTQDNTKL